MWGNYAKCLIIAIEKGFKEQIQDNGRREPEMQDTEGGRFPSPRPKSPACLNILIFTELYL